MSQVKGLSRLAVAAAVTCASMTGAMKSARAADVIPASDSKLSLDQAAAQPLPANPQYMDDTFTPWTLQSLAKGTTVGNFFDNYKLAVTGFVEGAYTFNFTRTPGATDDLRIFDTHREHLQLDQADIQLSRAVDYSGTDFNIGGLIEAQYGEDARYIHSNGLNFYGATNASIGPQTSPQMQADLTQAYLLFNAPVGKRFEVHCR